MSAVREERHKVLIRATVRAGGPQMEVCIRDISPRGVMMQTAMPPSCGTYVEILGVHQPIVGRVAWASNRRFGIRTSDRIDLATAIFGNAAHRQDTGPGAGPATLRPVFATAGAARANPEANRAFGRAFQFLVIGAFVAALSGVLALTMYDTLSGSFDRVRSSLGTQQ